VCSSAFSSLTVSLIPSCLSAALAWLTARRAAFSPDGPNGARSPVSGTMSPTVRVLLLLPPQPEAAPMTSAASASALVMRTNIDDLTSFSSPSAEPGIRSNGWRPPRVSLYRHRNQRKVCRSGLVGLCEAQRQLRLKDSHA